MQENVRRGSAGEATQGNENGGAYDTADEEPDSKDERGDLNGLQEIPRCKRDELCIPSTVVGQATGFRGRAEEEDVRPRSIG